MAWFNIGTGLESVLSQYGYSGLGQDGYINIRGQGGMKIGSFPAYNANLMDWGEFVNALQAYLESLVEGQLSPPGKLPAASTPAPGAPGAGSAAPMADIVALVASVLA